MIKQIIITTLAFTFTITNAQLKGSGKTISNVYNYQNFDKISLQDLDGTIEIEIGKEYAISVTIDDNLFPLFDIEESTSNNQLKLFLKNNKNNKKYIENTNINIKISMPKISELNHSGNSTVSISNVFGSNFKLTNTGNGKVSVSGIIDTIQITNNGNGNTIAKELISKKAIIACAGNGNVYVTVSDDLLAKATGNCTVFNFGKAKFNAQSNKFGNAQLQYQ